METSVQKSYRKIKGLEMNNEPKCWGMLDKDGNIYDVICPEEHARAEGSYTVPLYTAPRELSDEEIIEHYAKYEYDYPLFTLGDVKAILKKAREK